MSPHVCRLLQQLAASQPDQLAILEPGGRRVSFAELAENASRIAGGLRARGLVPGDRVVLLLGMGIDLYECLLGILWGGHTAVLVDPSAGLRKVDTRLGSFGVHGLIGTQKAHLLRLALPSLRGGKVYATDGWLPLTHTLTRLRSEPIEVVDPPTGEPALLTFTTGTTGLPKAMGRSHAFLLAQHHVLKNEMRIASTDIDLPTLPVFLLNSLAAGATAILPDGDLRDVSSLAPARMVEQIEAHGVTLISGSPAFFRPLVDWLHTENRQLTAMRKVFIGGARVPASLLADLSKQLPSARIAIAYGSTEAEPMAMIDATDVLAETGAREAAGEGCCVGAPVEGLAVQLRDPDLDERIDDGPGELLVSGDHVNQRYYQDPSGDVDNKYNDGHRIWHRTGDGAWIDGQGRIWLVGRVSERVAGMYPFGVECRAEALNGVISAGLAEVDGEAMLAFTGTAAESAVQTATGLRAVRMQNLPVDPRHRAKIDRSALADQISEILS